MATKTKPKPHNLDGINLSTYYTTSYGSVRGEQCSRHWNVDGRNEAHIFEPLKTEKRFVAIGAEWRNEHELPLPYNWPQLSEKQVKAFEKRGWNQYQKTKLVAPTSFVQRPPRVSCGGEFDPFDNADFMTRDKGIAEVAKQNRDYWPTFLKGGSPGPLFYNDGRTSFHYDWWVLLELGEQAHDYWEIEITRTGIGSLGKNPQWPMRIVLPTEDELSRYAIKPAQKSRKAGAA